MPFFRIDPQMCSTAFIEEEYLANLAVAILRLLGRLERPDSALATPLARHEIELLYAYFRCGFWMGRNNSVNNRFG